MQFCPGYSHIADSDKDVNDTDFIMEIDLSKKVASEAAMQTQKHMELL